MLTRLVKRKIILLQIILIASLTPSFSQQVHYTDISKIQDNVNILKNSEVAFIHPKHRFKNNLPRINFASGKDISVKVPARNVSKIALLKFNIANSSDSLVHVFFTPGFYYRDYKLYKILSDGTLALLEDFDENTSKDSYSRLKLNPYDSATILAALWFEKTYVNSLKPTLINNDMLAYYKLDLRNKTPQLNIFTYIFTGLLVMMIIFSIANYITSNAKEFIYYAGYAFFLGNLLFIKTIFLGESSGFARFFESYLDFIMQAVGVLFYMFFMKAFLNTKKKFRFLYHFYNTGIVLVLISIILFSILHFSTDNYVWELRVESITKYLLLLMIVAFIIYGFRRWNKKLLRYLVWGNLLLFIFSLVSQLMISYGLKSDSLPPLFNASIFYYEVGLFLELVFFLIALNYKTRKKLIADTRERLQLKTENQLKEAEKKLAVYKAQQEERNRISMDMHDELGSGMTAIRLMSELARKKMGVNIPKEIDRISSSANELLNKMNAIIWSMNSQHDTIENLIAYMRTYIADYLEDTNVETSITIENCTLNKEISGDKRRNIFLSVKEVVHNIVKHSQATRADIIIYCDHDLLKITIRDNGIGIDTENIRQFSNGLRILKSRMQRIGGLFDIQKTDGTLVTLELPFSRSLEHTEE